MNSVQRGCEKAFFQKQSYGQKEHGKQRGSKYNCNGKIQSLYDKNARIRGRAPCLMQKLIMKNRKAFSVVKLHKTIKEKKI